MSGSSGPSEFARTIIATQKSAERRDRSANERPARRAKSSDSPLLQAWRLQIQLALALEPMVKGAARRPGPRGTGPGVACA